jgi:hypothetical protein
MFLRYVADSKVKYSLGGLISAVGRRTSRVSETLNPWRRSGEIERWN